MACGCGGSCATGGCSCSSTGGGTREVASSGPPLPPLIDAGKTRRTLRPPAEPTCGDGARPTGRLDPSGNVARSTPRARSRTLLAGGIALATTNSGNAAPLTAEHCAAALAIRSRRLRPAASRPATSPAAGSGVGVTALPTLSRVLAAANRSTRSVPVKAGGPTAHIPLGPLVGALPRQQISNIEPVEPHYDFRYRDQSFRIPADWYREWLDDWTHVYREGPDAAHGRVHSVTETLDWLWADFRASKKGDPDVFHRMIGCYNLHREGDWEWGYAYQFWSSGMAAPFMLHVYTLQLLLTYVDGLDVEGVNPYNDESFKMCKDFPAFVKALLEGKAPAMHGDSNADGSTPESCTLTINYVNAQAGYKRLNEPCHKWGRSDSCDEGLIPQPGGCRGDAWDDWTLDWIEAEGCFTGNGSSSDCAPPRSGCGYDAVGAEWNIRVPPNSLAYLGLVSDRIMHLARLALDYAFYLFGQGQAASAMEYLGVAQRLSRYPLGLASRYAETLAHEMGHVYLGAGHCSHGHSCCFEVAANAWLCRVRAHLGLPRYANETRGSGDFGNPDGDDRDNCASCSTDDVPRYHYLRCDTGVDGEPGQTATVVSYPCWDKATARDLGCGEDA